MSYFPEFAERINAALARLDRSPSWLAQRLGVNPSTVSRWLNQGARPGDAETVVQVADILGLSEQVQALLAAAGYGYVEATETVVAETDSSPHLAGRAITPPPAAELLPDMPVRPRHNLPAQVMPLFGRAEELAALVGLLTAAETRLVTIVGLGGVGKTRLAQEVGLTLLDEFRDGVFFVPLAPLRRSEDIVTAVAEALDLTFVPGERPPLRQALDYLRRKQMLLVLDNCEHLPDTSGFVHSFLEAAPEVKVLTTSRQRLNLTGETVYALKGIDSGDEQSGVESDAVRFFLSRARLTRREYQPTEEDLPHIVRLCRLLHGLPLAILLAATWIELLSPREIVEQLTHSLDFLESDLRDLPVRQRSLRAVFYHSWALLSEQEQAVFSRLTVFQGSFSLAAAQRVADASLRVLMALVDKSLVTRSSNGRFELHELLRQYGAEQLGRSLTEQEAVRDRHASYYLEWLLGLTPDLHSARQPDAMEAMEAERENLRLAWEQGVATGRRELLSGAIRSLSRFFEWYGRYHEGATLFQRAEDALRDDDSLAGLQLQVQLLIRQARFQRLLGNRSQAEQLFRQVESLLAELQRADHEVRAAQAAILGERAELLRISDKKAAAALAREALALYEAVGDDTGMAAMLFIMGVSIYYAGDKKGAAPLLEESVHISRRLGSPREIAYALSWFGFSVYSMGREQLAESSIQEAYALFEKIGDRAGLARALRDLGGLYHVWGDFAAAETLHTRSRKAYEELGDMHSSIDTASIEPFFTVGRGKHDEARRLAIEVISAARAAGQTEAVGRGLDLLGRAALAEGALDEAYSRLTEAAQSYETSGGSAFPGVVNACIALTAGRLGRADEAQAQIALALELGLRGGSVHSLAQILVVAAWIKAETGELARAVELDALVEQFPFIAKNRWWWDAARSQVAAMAASLPTEIVEQARERGRSSDVEGVAAELLAEFKAQTGT